MKLLAKWLILTAMYFGWMHIYSEYIISRPVHSFVQTCATIFVVLITAGMLRYAVKDLLKFKK
jgi:hypothetical protein